MSTARFELFIAKRYILPKIKQLSAALISLLSLVVISLVVWLVIVFTSVTDGLEKTWIEKLIALSGPIRLQPTESYFDSYYFQIDGYSQKTDFRHQSLKEKLDAPWSDPFDKNEDQPLPEGFPSPFCDSTGKCIDLAKATIQTVHQVLPSTSTSVFELGLAQFCIKLSEEGDRYVSGMCYLTDTTNSAHSLDALHIAPELLESLGDDGVLVPKHFKENGIFPGDQGYLSYFGASLSTAQEQRLPIKVVGYYDPGLIPVAGKLLLTSHDIVSQIRTSTQLHQDGATTGISIWCNNYDDAKKEKELIVSALEKSGLSPFWKVETFWEYDYARDLLQQLHGDKTLFSLIAILILLVACSNIISMLILLVNDKKHEIGVLQALGASWKQILIIFCSCGAILGLVSATVGTLAAWITLENLDLIVAFLSHLEGHAAFNTMFFGEQLPSALSLRALALVWSSTILLSIIAGLIPAWKAASLKPAEILRAQ